MATSDIKIHYFDEDGRAEVSRLVLVWSGKPFEDIRVSFENWPAIKPTMPLGQVPVLEMDGEKYPQSLAIAAYLAKENGLYGQSNLDGLKIDVVSHVVLEFRMKASKHYYESDPEKKAELFTDLSSREAPHYLTYLDMLLVANGGNYMVGSEVTLADLIVYDLFKSELGKFTWVHIGKFPALKTLVERIGNTGVMKKYRKEKTKAL